MGLCCGHLIGILPANIFVAILQILFPLPGWAGGWNANAIWWGFRAKNTDDNNIDSMYTLVDYVHWNNYYSYVHFGGLCTLMNNE